MDGETTRCDRLYIRCVKAIASYKRKTGLKTPLVTCITDISMHPEWTASQTDIYLAPTQEIKGI